MNKVIISQKKEQDLQKEVSFSALRRANILAEKMSEDDLAHFGVKGMRWGIRNQRESTSTKRFNKKEERSLNRAAKKGMRITNRNYIKIYNKMADESAGLYAKINGFFEKKYGDQFNPRKYPNSKITKAYWNAADKAIEKSLQMHSNNILGSKIDSRLKVTWFVDIQKGLPSFYIELADEAKHSAETNKIQLIMTFDSTGKILKFEFPAYLFEEESGGELAHFGVIGMKWGVRNDRSSSSASRNTVRLVNKDAKRYADAKMFYGKGAGTRRKLLKAELEKKMKTIPNYEKLFNEKIKSVDYAKSAKKAKFERTAKDTAYRTRVTIKQVLGITGPLTVALGTALYFKNKDKVDSFVSKQFSKLIKIAGKL